jgi:hypothetical protein
LIFMPLLDALFSGFDTNNGRSVQCPDSEVRKHSRHP